jgi:hypothetical protein
LRENLKPQVLDFPAPIKKAPMTAVPKSLELIREAFMWEV